MHLRRNGNYSAFKYKSIIDMGLQSGWDGRIFHMAVSYKILSPIKILSEFTQPIATGRMGHKVNFKWDTSDLNLFSVIIDCYTKAKELKLSPYIVNRRSDGFIPKALAWNQEESTRIWTWVTDSISYQSPFCLFNFDIFNDLYDLP